MLNTTGRFLLGIITIGLVLLISIQILLGFDQTKSYLHWAERQVGVIKEQIFPTNIQKVSQATASESVTVKLLNSGNYPGVRILVNNERAVYFTNSTIQIPVKTGDLLIIDTRGIEQALWFEIIDYSSKVSSLQKGQQFRVRNDLKVIEIKCHDDVKY